MRLYASVNHFCDSPISISMNVASSGRARGSTPGSLKLVLSNMAITNRKSRAAKTGMAGDRWTARYGHLQKRVTDKDDVMSVERCVLRVFVNVKHPVFFISSVTF